VQNKCCFCKQKIESIAHYILDCKTIANERTEFLRSITTHLKKSNRHVYELWSDCMRKISDPRCRANLSTIIFGGNFALQKCGEWNLFRKTKYRHSHQSDKTCILTGKFLAKLTKAVA
jgi:hypothetical protein